LLNAGIEVRLFALRELVGCVHVDSSRDEIGDILARELYLSAGLDPTQAPGAPRLAAAVLGETYLHEVPRGELPGNALLRREGPLWMINVREMLTANQLNHAIAHELGEWFLRCKGYTEPDVEELSGRVAAAICVPRQAFEVAHAALGEDLSVLSTQFRVSESLMALRVAECSGVPTALITRRVVRTRGANWDWPSARQDWMAFVSRVRAEPNGISIRQLGDSRGRVVLSVR
jgi:IrrE N-terminal-like domain